MPGRRRLEGFTVGAVLAGIVASGIWAAATDQAPFNSIPWFHHSGPSAASGALGVPTPSSSPSPATGGHKTSASTADGHRPSAATSPASPEPILKPGDVSLSVKDFCLGCTGYYPSTPSDIAVVKIKLGITNNSAVAIPIGVGPNSAIRLLIHYDRGGSLIDWPLPWAGYSANSVASLTFQGETFLSFPPNPNGIAGTFEKDPGYTTFWPEETLGPGATYQDQDTDRGDLVFYVPGGTLNGIYVAYVAPGAPESIIAIENTDAAQDADDQNSF